ncbi:DUF2000 family protein [Loigolactobacillus coryniformis]|uniref:DUF2000 family protein n=1 Tax=Loigolactobacillus coryniformis TaxID=1610 RepID=UPI00345DFB0B
MQRNALVLAKSLSLGEVGNVAAILMGQLAQIVPTLFAEQPVLDEDKVRHAGIKYSTVVLKGGSGQIANLAKSLIERPEIHSVVFTATGQSLNNRFAEYAATIGQKKLVELQPVGIALSGEDSAIRALTKKFSLLQ